MKPRVLHVVTALGIGGVEVWLIALLAHMRERERGGDPTAEFDILMTGGHTAELDDIASSLGAKLHYIRFSRKEYPRFARQFRTLLEERKFTAIHDHQDYSAAWRLLAGAGRLPSIRIVHVHNPSVCLRINTHTAAQRILFRASRRIVKALATHVLGTSAQALREYGFTAASFTRQVVRPLHCGFDVDAFQTSPQEANASVCHEFGWPAGTRLCLFAGRLEGFDPRNPEWNHKNPQFALEVVREAIRQGTDTRLLVAGDGSRMRETLERRVASWDMSDRIRFAGKRLDMPRLMAASHVCLFPSLEEGLGMVAVEAQAAGVRVLASDTVPAEAAVLPELVSFLPLQDGPSAWAAELSRLLVLPRFDGEAAASAVRDSDFSIARSYELLHQIYTGARASGKP